MKADTSGMWDYRTVTGRDCQSTIVGFFCVASCGRERADNYARVAKGSMW